jgi:GNAT superfamily N-acetyltransferase
MWNYPAECLEIWKEELTITPEYIKLNTVFVFEKENQMIGFISLVENKNEKYIGSILVEKGFWMDHLFIHPEFQQMGIGKQLVEFLLSYCLNNQIKELLIFVDPYAVGFYEKLGAQFIRMSESSIPGRELPIFKITF